MGGGGERVWRSGNHSAGEVKEGRKEGAPTVNGTDALGQLVGDELLRIHDVGSVLEREQPHRKRALHESVGSRPLRSSRENRERILLTTRTMGARMLLLR